MTETIPFRAAHATAPEWRDAAAQIVVALGELDATHRLGFLYISDAYADSFDDIAVFLRQATGVPHWSGTIGMGVCATGVEYFDEPALSVLVTSFPDTAFRMFTGAGEGPDKVTQSLGDWLPAQAATLGVVHVDPRIPAVEDRLEELARETNGFLVGGLTASRGRMAQLSDTCGESDVSGVLLSLSEAPAQSGLTQGCSPIGPVHTVTEATENVILRLDDRPALDVLKEDVGEVLARDLQRAAGYIFAALPVKGSDTADYLVRNLTGIDPAHDAVAIGDYVSTGDTIMFCRRDHDSAVEDLRRMARDLKRRIGDAPIRGGLYFSCVARGPNQFGSGSQELGLIAEELGEFPLAGFFANGEISHDRLYGYTGVLTLFL
ncbi:MAG: FIST C-terminal domain-containing protein [Alphaproteobacteria bacterium]|nr:FIST C-terminal domain-containing protein [Alphaproteobacteria bacterium]